MDIFEILENIELEESAKTDFIAKFGEDTYNNFVKAKQRLVNAGLSVDFGQYLKKTKEEVDDMILSLYDDEDDAQKKRAMQGLVRNVRGKYKSFGEIEGYLVYQPLDYLSSMDLGINTGWCTTGRYGHAGHPEYTPSAKDAENHFNSYTRSGCTFYYLLDPKTFYGEYALVFRKKKYDNIEIIENRDRNTIDYVYEKSSDVATLNQVFNAADHAIPPTQEINRIVEKIQDKRGAPEKTLLLSNKLINDFELDKNNIIIKYWGTSDDATIPEEAAGMSKDALKTLLDRLSAESSVSISRMYDAYQNRFKYLKGTVMCKANQELFLSVLPAKCEVINELGEVIRRRRTPNNLFYLRGVYNSGWSENARYFFVSRQKAPSGMIAVRSDGAEWSRNHSVEDVVLFKTLEDANAFAKNINKRYPQYAISAYEIGKEKHAIASKMLDRLSLDDYVEANTEFGKCLVNKNNKYISRALTEGAKEISIGDAVDLMKRCVEEFNDKIFPVVSDEKFRFSFEPFYAATARQGTTSFGYDQDEGHFVCKISFNKNLLREGLEDIFINTIWHELCHYAVWKTLVDNSVVAPRSRIGGPGPVEGKEEEFDAECENSGHGKTWLLFADKVNNILHPAIDIKAHVSDDEMDTLFAAYDDDEIDYEIYCSNKDCDVRQKFIDFDIGNEDEMIYTALVYATQDSQLMKMILPTPMCKKCNSELYIKINNRELEEFLREHCHDIIKRFLFQQIMNLGA